MFRGDYKGFLSYLRGIVALAVLLAFVLFHSEFVRLTRGETHSELMGYKETGIASYYARIFMHSKTASGEPLNNNSMTAAHKTLPFGTVVKVTNLKNGKSVTVRINDRGPFAKGRIIDLTRAAFSQIADSDRGIVKVEIRVVK